MVGQGVLRECLLDPDVQQILSIVRTPSGQQHPKLRELPHTDFFDYSTIESQLTGYDTCFFCLGVSSAGIDEAKYTRLTYDLTLAAASTLALLKLAFPQYITTTEQLGLAMLRVAKQDYPRPILETKDIDTL